MSQIPVELQRYSLLGHYNFDKVVDFLNTSFKTNLKLGQLIEIYLKCFPIEMIQQCANKLIEQHKNGKYGEIYLKKIDHVIHTLEIIKKGKFNFCLRNLKEAHQFNDHYAQDKKEKLIKDLPELVKNYNCQVCNSVSFLDKSSLGSHQKACLKNNKQKKSLLKIEAPIEREINNVPDLQNNAKPNKIDQKVQINKVINEQQKLDYPSKVTKVNGQKRTKVFVDYQESDWEDIYEEQQN